MGLLDYLTAHAMDEDYAFVSGAHGETPVHRERRRPGAGASVPSARS